MAIAEDGGVGYAAQVEISALNSEIAEVATEAPAHPQHTLPFVSWKIGGGCGHWGTPAADYSEGWADGRARAVMLLNTMLMAGKRHELPSVLRYLAVDQVEAGLATSGHKGAILGFWDTIAKLLVPMVNQGNLQALSLSLIEGQCRGHAVMSSYVQEQANIRKSAAIKAAATRKARRAGQAVRS
jgi:hypothetical protein